MIFYFSGTGNSQLVANQIAMQTGDKTVFVNQYIKEGKPMFFESDKPLVFVAPTYAWRLPKVLSKWIESCTFCGNLHTYFVLTCGASCGNAAAYAKKLCKKTGLTFCGLSSIVMPENYIAMFEVPGKTESIAIIDRAKPHIAALGTRIAQAEPFEQKKITLSARLQSGIVNALFYRFIVHDKGFSVSDECVNCKRCFTRCPVNNIEMVGGKPHWKGNCTHCMACIGGCPTHAIEYLSQLGMSKGKPHFYIMEYPLNKED